MKPERLLFILFALYWVIVYGVTFFAEDNLKSQFRDTIPTGYRMFAPATDTNYDVSYAFYRNGKLTEEFLISDYLEKKKSIVSKSNFVEERLFLGLVKTLDFHYQTALYDEKYKQKENDFEQKLKTHKELIPIVQNLKNFPKVYLKENPKMKADSVSISVMRKPMVLPFDKEYKDDFTYFIGEKIFFQTSEILQP